MFMDSYTVSTSTHLAVRAFLRFTNNIFSRDDGWILEDVTNLNYIAFESDHQQFYIWEYRTVYMVTLESPLQYIKYTRRYMTIQELIAKIGGIINGLYILVIIIFRHYIKFIYVQMLALKSQEIIKDENKNNLINTNFLKDYKENINKNQEERESKLELKENKVSINLINNEIAKKNVVIEKIISIKPISVIESKKQEIETHYQTIINLSYFTYLKSLICFFKENKNYSKCSAEVLKVIDIESIIRNALIHLNQIKGKNS